MRFGNGAWQAPNLVSGVRKDLLAIVATRPAGHGQRDLIAAVEYLHDKFRKFVLMTEAPACLR